MFFTHNVTAGRYQYDKDDDDDNDKINNYDAGDENIDNNIDLTCQIHRYYYTQKRIIGKIIVIVVLNWAENHQIKFEFFMPICQILEKYIFKLVYQKCKDQGN